LKSGIRETRSRTMWVGKLKPVLLQVKLLAERYKRTHRIRHWISWIDHWECL